MAFTLTSPSFAEGDLIPTVHTCEGQNVSPPLAWSDPPHGTKSYALLVEDPDVPQPTENGNLFVHWVLYNVQQATHALALGANAGDLPNGAIQGRNDAGRVGYVGPCPVGGRHRYFFRLYALDAVLPQRGPLNRRELHAAMAGHVLGTTELMGRYARQTDVAREVSTPT